MIGDDKDEAEDDYPNQWTSPGYTDSEQLDHDANAHSATRINSTESQIPILVLPTDEEAVIADATRRLAVNG